MIPQQERPPGQTGGRKSWAGGPTDDTHHTGVGDTEADQLTLDDARERRDAGMTVATYSTDVAWTLAADRAIDDLARRGVPFTAEDVRAIVGAPTGSPNALGARFMAAARAGTIVGAGYMQATRTEAHGRILRRWVGAR